MSHLQGYVTNFQNLASLIKTLKDVGLKKFAIEKDSFENSISSIRLITFNYAIPFSFYWDGCQYNIISETGLIFSFSELTDKFFKLYTMNVITEQNRDFAFQFCSFMSSYNRDYINVERYKYEQKIYNNNLC